MKKKTSLLLVLLFVVANLGVINAQVPEGYYKKYHINQEFTGLEALPTGWTQNVGNTSDLAATSYFRNAAVTVGSGIMTLSAPSNSGGTRGIDVTFPSPQANDAVGTSSVWYLEFDWTITSAVVSAKNAGAIMFRGSQAQSLNTTAWYADAIFGLYFFDDGYLHYWNMDLNGPKIIEINSGYSGDPNDTYGAAFASGQYPAFNRAGATSEITAQINASTKTNVAYAAGKTYHILAVLNFDSQLVEKLVITDTADPANTQTFENHPFIAPSTAGADATVAVDDRKATDIAVISATNTRASNGGNGTNVGFNFGIDNIEIYYPEQSLGVADVTINYVDQNGNPVKTPRVVEDQEVGTIYSLIITDKEGFMDDEYYYAYNEEATQIANLDKGNKDGESVLVEATASSLTVVFKKTAITAGEYVWTGATSLDWNQLDDNFSVNGGANIPYQNGNSVTFSKTDAVNKDVNLNANLKLDMGDMTISAPGYTFGGTGRIEGEGTLKIDVATTIGLDNRLAGGALINTTDTIHVKSAASASTYKMTVDNAKLKLEANADFTSSLETPENGTLNVECVSNTIYAPSTLSNIHTLNIKMNTLGSHNANWRSAWRTTFPENSQVNVTTDLTPDADKRQVGFGVRGIDMKAAKLHLGDYIRLLRDYNETNNITYTNSTVAFGEITGTDKSVIEGGFIDGRSAVYEVGYLNTDAVFDGKIRQYMPTDTTSSTSLLRVVKVGTGKWTVNGDLLYTGELIVNEGTLELSGNIASSVTTVSVDTAAVLSFNNIVAETAITANIATLQGGVTANNISLTGSTYKLNVNSFADGDFDKIIAIGDFNTIAAATEIDKNILDITVVTADKDQEIQIIQVDGNADLVFDEVLVNGKNIIAGYDTYGFPITAEGADFMFTWDGNNGMLKSNVDLTGIYDVIVNKAIQSINYYDVTGRAVNANAKGLVIKKITYTDGTQGIQKVFVSER